MPSLSNPPSGLENQPGSLVSLNSLTFFPFYPIDFTPKIFAEQVESKIPLKEREGLSSSNAGYM